MGDTYVSKLEDTERDLTRYLQNSTRMVQSNLAWADERFARPGLQHARISFYRRPIFSTFITVLGLMSFLPVLSFISFSIFVTTSFIFIALGSAAVAIAAVETVLISLLLATISALVVAALFITPAIIGTYLAIRFVIRVRAEGTRAGASSWAAETKQTFTGNKSQTESLVALRDMPSDTASDTSAVIVGHEADVSDKHSSDEAIKVEGD